jgi:hypothetical protein
MQQNLLGETRLRVSIPDALYVGTKAYFLNVEVPGCADYP